MSTETKSMPMSLRLAPDVLAALRQRAGIEDRPVAAMAAHLIKLAVMPPKVAVSQQIEQSRMARHLSALHE